MRNAASCPTNTAGALASPFGRGGTSAASDGEGIDGGAGGGGSLAQRPSQSRRVAARQLPQRGSQGGGRHNKLQIDIILAAKGVLLWTNVRDMRTRLLLCYGSVTFGPEALTKKRGCATLRNVIRGAFSPPSERCTYQSGIAV